MRHQWLPSLFFINNWWQFDVFIQPADTKLRGSLSFRIWYAVYLICWAPSHLKYVAMCSHMISFGFCCTEAEMTFLHFLAKSCTHLPFVHFCYFSYLLSLIFLFVSCFSSVFIFLCVWSFTKRKTEWFIAGGLTDDCVQLFVYLQFYGFLECALTVFLDLTVFISAFAHLGYDISLRQTCFIELLIKWVFAAQKCDINNNGRFN